MLPDRHCLSDISLPVQIEFGEGDPIALGNLGQDSTPGIDDHTMTVGFSVSGVASLLRGCDHKDLIFDRVGTDQNLPVGFTGLLGKGGRGEDDHRSEIGEMLI